jgi:hypothetical protein
MNWRPQIESSIQTTRRFKIHLNNFPTEICECVVEWKIIFSFSLYNLVNNCKHDRTIFSFSNVSEKKYLKKILHTFENIHKKFLFNDEIIKKFAIFPTIWWKNFISLQNVFTFVWLSFSFVVFVLFACNGDDKDIGNCPLSIKFFTIFPLSNEFVTFCVLFYEIYYRK